MSLKEFTADLHEAAENTPFMQAVFDNSLPMTVWSNWTMWRSIFYKAIEDKCEQAGLLDNLEGIKRQDFLKKDYQELHPHHFTPLSSLPPVLSEYIEHIQSLTPQQTLAHLYVWHMGDLYGGQMIKKAVPAPSHYALEFEDASTLKNNLRAKLTDDLGPEARTAFEYAIKMLNEVYKVDN